MEHSSNSHKCKHSGPASPDEANFLTDTSAGCVWATSQQVFWRNTLQRVRSLDPLVTRFGGFPSEENGGKRPPWEMHTLSGLPAGKRIQIMFRNSFYTTIKEKKKLDKVTY